MRNYCSDAVRRYRISLLSLLDLFLDNFLGLTLSLRGLLLTGCLNLLYLFLRFLDGLLDILLAATLLHSFFNCLLGGLLCLLHLLFSSFLRLLSLFLSFLYLFDGLFDRLLLAALSL